MPLLKPKDKSVTVRMYRQGHGDCFLLAFPIEDEDRPFYVLIDCGYKPGSQKFIHKDYKKGIGEFVKHIGESTDNVIDLMIITHEHQDHVNGIWKKKNPYFQNITVKKLWLAWTENPDDDLANEIRIKYKDELLGLISATNSMSLHMNKDHPVLNRLEDMLSLELGGERESLSKRELLSAAADPSKSMNKQSIKYVKDKAREHDGISYLKPGGKALEVGESTGIKAYILGPPKNLKMLRDTDPDPEKGEGFHNLRQAQKLSLYGALSSPGKSGTSPFARKYRLSEGQAFRKRFFQDQYGKSKLKEKIKDGQEVAGNAEWRRIDSDWLLSAEEFALKLNTGINNTSLVIAFELPQTKKVLLFAADAQRGNWISWDDNTWENGGKEVTAKDILGRTVLYKVGHHGSHNATLDGSLEDEYPNLSWMGQGEYGDEFTAMITAVNKWAMEKNTPPWRHPLPEIADALKVKCRGRVIQTDKSSLRKPNDVSPEQWKEFRSRYKYDKMYFDLTIMDC